MKLVVIGLSLSSSWGNGHATTYRALLKALAARGADIDFLEWDAPWYAANRDLTDPEFCRLHFYETTGDLVRFDALIDRADAVILGSFVKDGVAVAERLLDRGSGPLAFYDIDTPVTLGKLGRGDHEYLTPALIPRFDLYLSFSGGRGLEILSSRYGARMARALWCGVDADAYRPLEEPAPPRWDLGYLGTFSPDRQAAVERLLIEPAKRAPERRFVVAGPQYPDDIAWPANVDRIEHVPPSDHRAFYAGCRFSLNATRAEMIALGHSPSVRLFEAAACGTAILSDRWPGIEDAFEPGREIALVDSPEDVVAALDGAVDVMALGRAARARVLAEHTAERRAASLESWLGEAAAFGRERAAS